ncbi:endonuclease/exonuclease/phosphatase family protein [Microbacterium sp.]|uniref:endonuclease/exonuclease/phosphatase family protein n=1 Tax=Microbacterium sp. TaxID=51671 RepID=UPI003C72A063
MKAATWGVGVAGVIALAAVILPLAGEAASSPLLFALAAFRALTLLASMIVVAAIAVLLFLVRRRKAAAIVAMMVVLLAVPFFLGLGGGTAPDVPAAGSPGELRILSWNTDQREVDDDLMVLVEQTQPDIIALPEYFTTTAQGRLEAFAEKNDLSIYGWESSSATVLVADRLGTYRPRNDDTPLWAGISLVPDDPDSPPLVVAHLQGPMLLGGNDLWREHIEWVRSRCDAPNVIAVGDFNATVANLGADRLGSCIDVGSTLDQRASGTWPASLPAALGAQIDHVFAGSEWRASWFGVLEAPRTEWAEAVDHRPIFAVLTRG